MQLETTVTVDEAMPGLKAALSASLPDAESGKLALTYAAIKNVGAKCDVGLKAGAKFNANACMVSGPLAMGGALCLDTGRHTIQRHRSHAAPSHRAPRLGWGECS
jgi:hypothetical protein